MNETQATDLLKRFSSGNCTEEEQQLVEEWYKELVNSGELEYEEGEKESIQEAIEAGILQNIATEDRNYTPYVPYTPVRRTHNRTWWAAAAILVCLSGTVVYLLNKKAALSIAKAGSTLKNDVEPGGNKAVLTLANGSTILLDDAANGVVAKEGSAKVVKPDDGKLVYSSENNQNEEPLSYNTLATPRSGQYQLRLPDGTKVWLNAASSIHFPTGFRGKERRVQITGEAYFEVAHDSSMPFIVEKDDLQVEVLGTHFNVNAYSDESAIKTTLLEGKVKVIEKTATVQQTAILTPGEQAVIPKSTQIQVRKADVDDVMAWKNGLFHFENADIKTVMRQLARWYDVEVVYEGVAVKNDPLFVEISRNTRLSDVLKVLQESGSAKFSIQGKKIVVK
ncbi:MULTISPECIES: FecR family protein [Niastella]|uniref:FecR domain-containing protein n=1 Tax=Niastella soli TaxID=2821487 RepID=A0ABS3YRP5_9BACT|nr:FecR family protein [Niastella soli]MBO9200538.1 FecR domain-containing protein [Niastella soli]